VPTLAGDKAGSLSNGVKNVLFYYPIVPLLFGARVDSFVLWFDIIFMYGCSLSCLLATLLPALERC